MIRERLNFSLGRCPGRIRFRTAHLQIRPDMLQLPSMKKPVTRNGTGQRAAAAFADAK